MAVTKLTIEESEMAGKHYGLALKFTSRFSAFYEPMDKDEVQYQATLGLCEAVCIFDESRNIKFSTVAWKCMRTRCGNQRRAVIRKIRLMPNVFVGFGWDESLPRLEELALARDEVAPYVEPKDRPEWKRIEEATLAVSRERAAIIRMRLSGKNSAEIAEAIGCTRANASKLIRDFFLSMGMPLDHHIPTPSLRYKKRRKDEQNPLGNHKSPRLPHGVREHAGLESNPVPHPTPHAREGPAA